ncbi:MAG: Rne/Rng family ribonuclease [Lachnospiraceae bacterium]|nr:Rne/Rng family ribonuclease [Lachnospiraceae bacterium]
MNRIIMDSTIYNTRTALVLDGVLTELLYESNTDKNLVGSIYCGRVIRVLPGINAAFVEIGEERTAYLQYADEGEGSFSCSPVKAGDSVIVQVKKSPVGLKGALLTRKISFAGKFSILIPNDKNIGISKKIVSEKERERISEIVAPLLPEGYGIIVRTMGEGKNHDDFKKEIEYLYLKSKGIFEKADYLKPPCLVMSSPSPALFAARDIFSDDVDEFIVNNEKDYNDLLNIADENEAGKIKLYNKSVPVFEEYFIESQAKKALDKKVWLKSGGFIVIEETEALTVIDVNTGKYTGTKDIQKTFLKTNIEAVYEASKQIRLRNLSGIIIIDFIDMQEEEDRQLIKKTLMHETSKDRIKTVVVSMTELNLMQLTRRKTRPSLSSQILIPCPLCAGTGKIYNAQYVLGSIYRDILSLFSNTIYDKVQIYANETILRWFYGKEDSLKQNLEDMFNNKEIELIPIKGKKHDYYEIKGIKRQ